MSDVQTELFCLQCQRETPHHVWYVRDRIARLECTVCGHVMGMLPVRALQLYAGELVNRALTKPLRMSEELRRQPSSFFFSLPGRLLTKPVRMAQELRTVRQDYLALRRVWGRRGHRRAS